jgi:hypothetical protein
MGGAICGFVENGELIEIAFSTRYRHPGLDAGPSFRVDDGSFLQSERPGVITGQGGPDL